MIQVVVETNVVVAALRSSRGASYRLLSTLEHETWRPNVSVALALEYEDVLKRPGMLPGFTHSDVDDFLDYIFSQSNLVSSVRRLRPALPDPDDDRILEVAVSCGAVIVTHNLRDFEAASWRRVEAVSPAELLRRLQGSV
jgi:putative PIN family toxin of toxin-antitoxin system